MLEPGCLSDLALWDGIVHCRRSWYRSISAFLVPALVMRRAISSCEHFPHTPSWSKQVSYLPPQSYAGALVGRRVGKVSPSLCVPKVGTQSPADSQLAGTLPSLTSPWGSPGERVAAQMTARQSLCRARHHVIHHRCCSATTGLLLIAFLFNESRWTLKPQRSYFRQSRCVAQSCWATSYC